MVEQNEGCVLTAFGTYATTSPDQSPVFFFFLDFGGSSGLSCGLPFSLSFFGFSTSYLRFAKSAILLPWRSTSENLSSP
jgi:hypothetical protein